MADTYADLYNRILDETNRSGATETARVKLEILAAIKHYERQRFWFNEARETASLVLGDPCLSPDSVMLSFDNITITYNSHLYDLQERTWAWYRSISGDDTSFTTSVPTDFAYYANCLWFYPIPNSAYSIKWSGIKQLTALSADGDSNEWTISGEELIRTRAKAAYRVNYLEETSAMADMQQMAGSPYYSMREKIAHLSLLGTAVERMSTGRLTPTYF